MPCPETPTAPDIPLTDLLEDVRQCRLCAPDLPLGPRPVIRASATARLLIIGQAPGMRVHKTGIPWNDPSGQRLRTWLGISDEVFYDEDQIAIMPMGFCYPGKGPSGDLPPRKECAPAWHDRLLRQMPDIRLTLLIGQYAQRHYARNSDDRKLSLTERVRVNASQTEGVIALPHPSPRNRHWLTNNPWFEQDTLPALRANVQQVLE